MPRIGHAEVAHVASLARLALSESELESMARDLEQILAHVASLDAVDTQGVPPTLHGFDLPTPLRADRPARPLDPELAVANAPSRQGTAFLVPKVLEGGPPGRVRPSAGTRRAPTASSGPSAARNSASAISCLRWPR